MTQPINLNKARQAKARAAKEQRAAENRAKYGRSKAEKHRDALAAERHTKPVDGAKRED